MAWLGFGWLLLGFGLISAGFRLDFGFGLIWLDSWFGLIWIWLDFGLDFIRILLKILQGKEDLPGLPRTF